MTVTSAAPKSGFRGKIYDSILETIGGTPLVRFKKLAAEAGVKADIVGKLEFFNPLSAALPEQLLVGHAAIVEQTVDARYSGATRRINLQDVLYFKDQVITAQGAKTVIEFRDGSTLEMGPSAVMTIDELVFNPAEGTNNKSITMVSGTFRYLSGFVSHDAKVEFHTGSATIGIRGSAMVAVIDPNPAQPAFIQMANGSATVTNQNGSVQLAPGQATAVPAGRAPAQALPAPVIAQALQRITQQLGATPATLPPPQPQQAEAVARANTLPVSAQQAVAASAATNPAAPLPVPNTASVTTLALLVEANGLGMLSQAPGVALSAAQQAFVVRAQAAFPGATQAIQNFNTANQAANVSNQSRSTGEVVSGASKAAPAQIGQLVTSASAANPGAAAIVAAAATSAVPDAAVQVATAATQAAPAQAASIASAVTQAAPTQAVAVASAVTQAAPSQAAAVAAAVTQAVPAQAAAVASAVTTAAPSQAAAIASAVTQVAPSQAAVVAASVTQAAPSQAVAVASAVTQAAPSQAAMVAASVSQVAPQSTQAVVAAAATASNASVASVTTAVAQDTAQATAAVQQASLASQQAQQQTQAGQVAEPTSTPAQANQALVNANAVLPVLLNQTPPASPH